MGGHILVTLRKHTQGRALTVGAGKLAHGIFGTSSCSAIVLTPRVYCFRRRAKFTRREEREAWA